MSDGNGIESCGCNCRGHTWYDLKLNTLFCESQSLFSSSSKYKWVATFEANHPFAAFGGFEHQTLDSRLVKGWTIP